MQVETWNHETITQQLNEGDCLADVIEALEVYYEERNQLVCEIRVNEMLLEGDDEKRFAATPLAEIREIQVSVGALQDLLRDVRHAFCECIPSLQETSLSAADFFRDGNLEKAQNVFSALLEGCQWLVDTLVHTRRASVRHSSGIFTESRWQEVEKEFSQSIRQILVAFEKRDYALLADILEYEITGTLESWLLLLGKPEVGSDQKEHETPSSHPRGGAQHFDEEILKENAENKRLQDPMGGQ